MSDGLNFLSKERSDISLSEQEVHNWLRVMKFIETLRKSET